MEAPRPDRALRAYIGSRINPIHRVLFGNSSILIVQLAVLGVGGLGFWVIAAGKFDVSTLGTASVLVALTAFVIYATTLGLPVTVGRFGAGTSDVDRAVFSWSMVTTLVSSAVGAGVVSLLAAGGWFPEYLAEGPLAGFLVLFSGVAGASVVVLVDYRQLRLGRRRQVVLRSVVVAVVRVAVIAALPASADPFWIWVSMSLPAPLVALLLYPTWRSDCPVLLRRTHIPDVGRILRFTGTNCISLLLVQAPFFAFPIVVVSSLPGADDRGIFYVVWTIANIVFLVPQVIGRALLIEAAEHEVELRRQAWYSLKISLATVFAMTLASVPVALLLPLVYGEAYRPGRVVLVMFVVALVPFSVTSTTVNFARARENNGVTIAVSLVLAVCLMVPASKVSSDLGSVGVAMAWLFGHSVAAFMSLMLLDLGMERRRDAVASIPWTARAGRVCLYALLVAVPMLISGWTGLAILLGVLALNASGARWVAVPTATGLLVISGLATMLEGRRVVGLGYAADRPLAGAAAAAAMAVVFAWAVLELLGERPFTSPVVGPIVQLDPDRPTAARLPAVWRRPATKKWAWAMLGAISLGINQSSLSDAAQALVRHLESGWALPNALDGVPASAAVSPLASVMVAFGPLPSTWLGAACGAIVFAVIGAAVDRRSVRWSFGLVGVAVVCCLVPSIDLSVLLAVTLIVSCLAVLANATTDRSLVLCGVLLGSAALAAVESLVPALVIIATFTALGVSGRAALALAASFTAVLIVWGRIVLDVVTIHDLTDALSLSRLLFVGGAGQLVFLLRRPVLVAAHAAEPELVVSGQER